MPIQIFNNFINNSFVSSSVESEYIDGINPSNNEVIYRIPDSGADVVEAAVLAASIAFTEWKNTSREYRSKLLLKIADILESKLAIFAEAESLDQGKPLWLSTSVDIPRAVANFRFFATQILHWTELATEHDVSGCSNVTQSMPIGVAGLISPWNLPLYLLTWKIAPAIAAGNCVICKPSELTSYTAYLFGEVLIEAGLPSGVVNIIFGSGSKTGAAIVAHPKVKMISFTGGTETGMKISRLAADHIKKLSLELGGKNANVIFADADLSQVLKTTLKSSFLNQGEICLCGSRIFVQRRIYDEFIDKFKIELKSWKVGDPLDENSMMGPLISKTHYEKVQRFIANAGKFPEVSIFQANETMLPSVNKNGYYLPPTLIIGASPLSEVMQQEIFGPVVTIHPFDTEEDAIQLANNISYGLSASIWTENLGLANRVARQLEVGTVWINCWMVRDLRMPFGGMKASGIGREGGLFSLDFFTEKKNICTKFY